MAESSQNTGTMSDSLSRIPDIISLKYLPDHEKLSSKVLQKGLNYFTQGYIHEIKVLEFENKIRVEARCWPSMKNQPPHRLHIEITEEKCEDAYCSCKAGVLKVDEKDMSYFSNLKGTPLEYRIAPNIPTVSTPLGDVQIGSILLYQTKYMRETTQISQDCGNTYVTRASPVRLPDEFKPLNENTKCINPCDTEVQTRNQALSDHWFHERKGRLTTSNFGKVISRKSKPSEKFQNMI